MHGYDVLELFYLNCEVYGPLVMGSGSRAGRKGHIVNTYRILESTQDESLPFHQLKGY